MLAPFSSLSPIGHPRFAGASGGDITTGLKRWYKFDEGSGSVAVDSGSDASDGALVGSPSYVTGKIGAYGISFNGSSQSVTLANPIPIVPGFTWTVAAWVKHGSAQDLFLFDNRYGAGHDGIIIYVRSGVANVYMVGNGISSNPTGSTIITDGAWHHVAATFDNANLIIYVDGAQDASVARSFAGGFADSSAASFGASFDGFGHGSQDDTRIYSRALSSDDSATLYAYR